jgi:hypothetical protein
MEPQFAVDRKRWVFDDYVVYANDRCLAEEIHTRVRSESHVRALFGIAETPAGTGYWVRIVKRDD